MHIGREKEKRFTYVDVQRQDTRIYRKSDLFSSIVTLPPSNSFMASACIKILSRQSYNREPVGLLVQIIHL